jgi:hypothetical protein
VNPRALVLPLLGLLFGPLAGCASTPEDDGSLRPALSPEELQAQRGAAEEADFLERLQEAIASPDREDQMQTMNTLEHLLPSWQNEQRRGREKPLERIITIKVVSHFDAVLDSYEHGPRERRMVAAWALGFARVPPNDMGLASPHERALEALSAGLADTDDELLRNVLLGLWKLGDPNTPLPPILDIMVQHHDPDVRANAALALTTVLGSPERAVLARDGLLVALSDSEAKVRLHAAAVLRRYPDPAGTERLLQLLPAEQMPLVRAAMASALGAAGSRSAGQLLLPMLGSAREIESTSARDALARIYGEDRGADPAAWADLVR